MEDAIIAGLFGKVFIVLSREPEQNKTVAYEVWKLTKDYDFDKFLMGCDDSLIKLELGYRDEQERMIYQD